MFSTKICPQVLDWIEFKDYTCAYLYIDVPTDDEDDPDADPEYNVLAEAEPEVDEDDHILPVRVTSKWRPL